MERVFNDELARDPQQPDQRDERPRSERSGSDTRNRSSRVRVTQQRHDEPDVNSERSDRPSRDDRPRMGPDNDHGKTGDSDSRSGRDDKKTRPLSRAWNHLTS
jgi:hypothetical protein